MVINYDCVYSDHVSMSFIISVKLLPTSEALIRKQKGKPSHMWYWASLAKSFLSKTQKLVLFYPALMYQKLLYVVPTLIVSYSCTKCLMILYILLPMLPMSFLLKLITRF